MELPQPVWRIELLGGLRVTAGDTVVTGLGTRKAAALLGLLALNLGRPMGRENLAELLWPDEDPADTRDRFRQELTKLRRAFGSGLLASQLLLANRSEVALNETLCETDVSEFDAALRMASTVTGSTERRALLECAVSLYSGGLLPGIYEECIGTAREQFELQRRRVRLPLRPNANADRLTSRFDCRPPPFSVIARDGSFYDRPLCGRGRSRSPDIFSTWSDHSFARAASSARSLESAQRLSQPICQRDI